MDVQDKVCVVTGGASGIWLALCTRFAGEVDGRSATRLRGCRPRQPIRWVRETAPDARTPGRCSAQSSSQFVSPSALQMS